MREARLRLLSLLACALFVQACAWRQAPQIQLHVDATLAEDSDLSGLIDMIAGGFPADDRQQRDQFMQASAILGREDLFGKNDKAVRATGCLASNANADIFSSILLGADSSQIVIINEAHHRSLHRVLTLRLIEALREKGFSYFAAETFDFADGKRASPPSYLLDTEGYYSKEAIFGRAARRALALGYTLVDYEISREQLESSAPTTMEEATAIREEAQANNFIERIINDDPAAKVIVHVGYSHAAEAPLPGFGEEYITWFAARIKERLRIDPYTITQSDCEGGGEVAQVAKSAPRTPPGAFDMIIDHPLPRYVYGRPVWRETLGDMPTLVPSELWPETGWAVIEARNVDEPDEAVPVDRLAVNSSENNNEIKLMLPPGRYRVRAIYFPESN